jgi:hypothetical protein
MKRKTRRKQPRRMTPPLFLRDAETGERSVIELDESGTTDRAQVTGCVRAFLKLGQDSGST